MTTATCPALAAYPCCNHLQQRAQRLHVPAVRYSPTAHRPAQRVHNSHPPLPYRPRQPHHTTPQVFQALHTVPSSVLTSSPAARCSLSRDQLCNPASLAPASTRTTQAAGCHEASPCQASATDSSSTRPSQGHTHSSFKTPCQQNPGSRGQASWPEAVGTLNHSTHVSLLNMHATTGAHSNFSAVPPHANSTPASTALVALLH